MVKGDLEDLGDRVDASLKLARSAKLDVLALLLSMASLEVSRLIERSDADQDEHSSGGRKTKP